MKGKFSFRGLLNSLHPGTIHKRYEVRVSGYASGRCYWFWSFKAAENFYESVKRRFPWACLSDGWRVDKYDGLIILKEEDNSKEMPAPPVLENGQRLEGYVYDV